MAKEIERKFLVRGEFLHLASRHIEIVQGYLSVVHGRTIRLRISDGNKAILSIKSPVKETDFSRHEWEFEIPVSEALEILKICIPEVISKTRYIVPFSGHKFEVDIFHGKNEGLIIAELELAEEDEIFEKPAWLGEEVTGNPQYYNSNLI